MKNTITVLLAGILAGALAVYLIPRESSRSVAPSAPALEEVQSTAGTPPPRTDVVTLPVRETAAPVTPKETTTPAQPSAWARLAEKYGPEKTALSSKITSNITSLVQDGVNLGQKWAQSTGSQSVSEAATKNIMRGATTQLGLSEAQQQQASPIIQSLIDRRMEAVAELTSAMHAEPEQIMEMLLAGDALARKEISQQDYDRLTLTTRTMLRNLAGYSAPPQPGQGGLAQLMGDEATAEQLNAILNPEQRAKLAEFAATAVQRAEERRQRSQRGQFQPGEIPVMELEKLDQSIASVKKMAEAAGLMMDGMQGLREVKARTANPTDP